MKRKICLVLFFLFSIVNIGATTRVDREDSFYLASNKLMNNMDFCENGVKVVYQSNSSLEDEMHIIEDKLQRKYTESKIEVSNKGIKIDCENQKVSVDLYNKAGMTCVEIALINYKKEKNIQNLMKELTELQGNNVSEKRYFKYVKGRINDKENALDIIESTKELKHIDTLDIRNGYVGTAVLDDRDRVNFAVSTYNTGTYLIVGTPIIFTTY